MTLTLLVKWVLLLIWTVSPLFEWILLSATVWASISFAFILYLVPNMFCPRLVLSDMFRSLPMVNGSVTPVNPVGSLGIPESNAIWTH